MTIDSPDIDDICDNSFRRNGNRRKPIPLFSVLLTFNFCLLPVLLITHHSSLVTLNLAPRTTKQRQLPAQPLYNDKTDNAAASSPVAAVNYGAPRPNRRQ